MSGADAGANPGIEELFIDAAQRWLKRVRGPAPGPGHGLSNYQAWLLQEGGHLPPETPRETARDLLGRLCFSVVVGKELDEEVRMFVFQAAVRILEGEDPSKALLLKRQGGRGRYPDGRGKALRDVRLAVAVWLLRTKDGCDHQTAVQRAAESNAVSESVVDRAFKDWGHRLGEFGTAVSPGD